jgi:hypothetical protein
MNHFLRRFEPAAYLEIFLFIPVWGSSVLGKMGALQGIIIWPSFYKCVHVYAGGASAYNEGYQDISSAVGRKQTHGYDTFLAQLLKAVPMK